jgi:hypothetical protein
MFTIVGADGPKGGAAAVGCVKKGIRVTPAWRGGQADFGARGPQTKSSP